MYSIAQHAVAKGYGKIEYLRAQPIALSSRVSTTASPSSASSPEVARRGFGGRMGLAIDRSSIRRLPACQSRLHSARARASGARAMALLTRWVHLLAVAVYLGATLAVGRVGADGHEGDAGEGDRATLVAARGEAVADVRADQRGDVLLLRPRAPARARGAGTAAGRTREAGGNDPAHAAGGVDGRRARGVDGVGRSAVGALTGSERLRAIGPPTLAHDAQAIDDLRRRGVHGGAVG